MHAEFNNKHWSRSQCINHYFSQSAVAGKDGTCEKSVFWPVSGSPVTGTAEPRPATDGLRVPSDISTLSSSATMMTNDANHAKLTDPYLYGLSELQVEGNDTHTLQPGGEPGPRTPAGPAVRRLLMSGRTGAVKRVHHDRIRAPRPPSSILRPSITIMLPTPSERRLTGRWSPLLDPSGTNTSGTDPSGTDTSGTDITDTHQLSLLFYFSKTRCKTVPCACCSLLKQHARVLTAVWVCFPPEQIIINYIYAS